MRASAVDNQSVEWRYGFPLRLFEFFLIIGLFCIAFILCSQHFFLQSPEALTAPITAVISSFSDKERKSPTNRSVVILTWTSFFGSDLAVQFYMNGLAKCKYVCTATSNRSELTAAAAVVFHLRNTDPSDLPQSRSPHQFFVFYLLESPYHSGSALRRIRRDYFNITMTYRLDSDVHAAYGQMRPIDNSTTPDEMWKWNEIETIVKGKTKSALIVVSNCETNSKREVYVRALAKHIEITRLGACSKMMCNEKCAEEAIAQHYFYLAFENSVCRDYVTEKVFWYMEKIIVPIVLKRSFASSILPNGSFIAADDFNSPASLAEHLKYLRSNKEKYMKYFEWVKIYRKNLSEGHACNLCRFLHKNSDATRVIADIGSWWYDNEMCIDHYAERLLYQKDGSPYR